MWAKTETYTDSILARWGFNGGAWSCLTCLSVCLCVSVWQETETSSARHARKHLIAAPAAPPALYYSNEPTWNSTAVAVHLLYSSLLFLSVCQCDTHTQTHTHVRRCFPTPLNTDVRIPGSILGSDLLSVSFVVSLLSQASDSCWMRVLPDS